MSKKELNLEKLESLNKLKVKKAEPNPNTEKAIESIHSTSISKERTKRITIDLPISLYKKIRKESVEKESH